VTRAEILETWKRIIKAGNLCIGVSSSEISSLLGTNISGKFSGLEAGGRVDYTINPKAIADSIKAGQAASIWWRRTSPGDDCCGDSRPGHTGSAVYPSG